MLTFRKSLLLLAIVAVCVTVANAANNTGPPAIASATDQAGNGNTVAVTNSPINTKIALYAWKMVTLTSIVATKAALTEYSCLSLAAGRTVEQWTHNDRKKGVKGKNFMKDILYETLKDLETLEEIQEALLAELAKARESHDRAGYVAGLISSQGYDKIDENLKILLDHTQALRLEHQFPVFSAPEVYVDGTLHRLIEKGYGQKDFFGFWRDVLGSGHITDLFMAPNWESSFGARDEHETAKSLGIRIHYL
ncbi:MAG: hypothetical protein COT91_04135 [Candidatus Doudnabacteria bacterium CG10_big_fil_rev_8_21_14_0_10_41_10]|uniref:Uncharacterized protein n=1 Tax=Candidatus Doudnabacteria bacterium CG10_big_fil_rev_8_21_14_0_10_41_10 TaxID=1974551 RepID=A0A2H0VEZ9_9BACT|nr:MAG: hypothetical protein COT91_04135 [Candidatus Doudnabacteria bacterium CG10_big_fil_rev_8_21_14_0_10_41_10]